MGSTSLSLQLPGYHTPSLETLPHGQTSHSFLGPRHLPGYTPREPTPPSRAHRAHEGRIHHFHQDFYQHRLVLTHKLITLGKGDMGPGLGMSQQMGTSKARGWDVGGLDILFLRIPDTASPAAPGPNQMPHPPTFGLFCSNRSLPVAPFEPTDAL